MAGFFSALGVTIPIVAQRIVSGYSPPAVPPACWRVVLHREYSEGNDVTPRETEEFAALWAKAMPTIAAFIRSLTPDFQQAEEILQRVAVTLVHTFSRYDRSKPFAPWAIGIAKNEVLYFRRQRATDRHVFDDELVGQLAASYQRLVEEGDSAEEALAGCLEELAGRARQALRLRYVSGLSSAGIAEEMQLSAGAVRMLLCRARAALRECIERQSHRSGTG